MPRKLNEKIHSEIFHTKPYVDGEDIPDYTTDVNSTELIIRHIRKIVDTYIIVVIPDGFKVIIEKGNREQTYTSEHLPKAICMSFLKWIEGE